MNRARRYDATAAILRARQGLSMLEREMAMDCREGLELLDEQIISLRHQGASELLAAREDIARATSKTDAMLDGVQRDVGTLWRRMQADSR